ncbi:hypothetical protein KPH14_000989 [Odynerus spinipes]|uniref:Uncharacterized protein n=1 Tax=Odynerus spinipes TaxID=1348599 RepID=A0AAD9REZ7_9HYME|nr:hypothetical protein KPH14_000989 [Odynerus spinipes]
MYGGFLGGGDSEASQRKWRCFIINGKVIRGAAPSSQMVSNLWTDGKLVAAVPLVDVFTAQFSFIERISVGTLETVETVETAIPFFGRTASVARFIPKDGTFLPTSSQRAASLRYCRRKGESSVRVMQICVLDRAGSLAKFSLKKGTSLSLRQRV